MAELIEIDDIRSDSDVLAAVRYVYWAVNLTLGKKTRKFTIPAQKLREVFRLAVNPNNMKLRVVIFFEYFLSFLSLILSVFRTCFNRRSGVNMKTTRSLLMLLPKIISTLFHSCVHAFNKGVGESFSILLKYCPHFLFSKGIVPSLVLLRSRLRNLPPVLLNRSHAIRIPLIFRHFCISPRSSPN